MCFHCVGWILPQSRADTHTYVEYQYQFVHCLFVGFKTYTQSREEWLYIRGHPAPLFSPKLANSKTTKIVFFSSQTARARNPPTISKWGSKPYFTSICTVKYFISNLNVYTLTLYHPRLIKTENSLFLEYISTSDNCTLNIPLPVGSYTDSVPHSALQIA